MKAGVRTTPWGVVNVPARAAPSVASRVKSNISNASGAQRIHPAEVRESREVGVGRVELRAVLDVDETGGAADEGLPPGWVMTQDPNTGKTYYANAATGQSSWTIPTA